MDTIERSDDIHMREELGDLLFQVVFHCQLAKERGAFNWNDVVQEVFEKLVRRHPHVYDNKGSIKEAGEVLFQWDEIKKKEKEGKKAQESILDDIPKALPAIQKSEKIQSLRIML